MPVCSLVFVFVLMNLRIPAFSTKVGIWREPGDLCDAEGGNAQALL